METELGLDARCLPAGSAAGAFAGVHDVGIDESGLVPEPLDESVDALVTLALNGWQQHAEVDADVVGVVAGWS